MAQTLWEQGIDIFNSRNIPFSEKDYQPSLEKFKNSLTLYRELGDKQSEADVLTWIARVYMDAGDNFADAKNCLKKSQDIYNELNSSPGTKASIKDIDIIMEAMLFYVTGRGYRDVKDYKVVLEKYKFALQLLRKIGERFYEARILMEIGEVSGFDLKNYSEAEIYYQEALVIFRELGKEGYEGRILACLGDVYYDQCLYHRSLEYLDKAMHIYKKHNMIIDQASTLVEIGKVNRNLGNYLEAIDNLQEALKISEGVEDSDSIKGLALTTIGGVYSLLGDEETAKEYFLKHSDIKKPDIKNKWDQLTFLRNQGSYFIKENKSVKVLEVINKILILSKETDDNLFEEVCLSEIGVSYICLREYKKGLIFYKQGLEVSRKHNDKARELIFLFNIAETYYPFLSDYQNALDYYEQALVMAKEIGDKSSQAKCFAAMGKICIEQKELGKSEEYYKNALKLSKKMGTQEKIWETQNKLGLLASLSGDLQKAKSYYSEAINTIESMRENISVEEYKTSFIENKLLVYNCMIYTLLELEEDEEAFNYVERAKSRTLLDMLGNMVKLGKGKDKELSQEEMKLQKKINGLLEKIRKGNSQQKEKQRVLLKEWNEEVEQARKEYAQLLVKTKQENPELYSIVSVNPLTLKEVQAIIEPDTTLLEYYTFPETDIMICWVVNKNEYEVFSRNILKLPSKIAAFREKIKNFQSDYEKEARDLYELLIRPAKPYIKTKRIGIIPHSVLHFLPFQALINANGTEKKTENHFLIEEYDIFYAPSASVLKFALEKRKEITGKVLAFGNPEFADKDLNLPHAEEEVKRIKESYPDTSIYMNEQATEEKVKQLSGDYGIIHFASHGELNPRSPLFSCVKMAKEKDEDGRLEVHEIFNLNLEKASLVTLSACETGLGKLTNGDELIGLTRGFIYAGTPSIVASLWMVNDKSTSDLMSLFYKNLKTHSKVESLRMAQLEMINGEVGKGIVRGVGGISTSKESEDKPQSTMTVNGSHPYFWAPFILLGDWK